LDWASDCRARADEAHMQASAGTSNNVSIVTVFAVFFSRGFLEGEEDVSHCQVGKSSNNKMDQLGGYW
jgi:hypothetical protein